MSIGQFTSAAKFLKPNQRETSKKIVKRLRKTGKENRTRTRQTKTPQKRPCRNKRFQMKGSQSWHISMYSIFNFQSINGLFPMIFNWLNNKLFKVLRTLLH